MAPPVNFLHYFFFFIIVVVRIDDEIWNQEQYLKLYYSYHQQYGRRFCIWYNIYTDSVTCIRTTVKNMCVRSTVKMDVQL